MNIKPRFCEKRIRSRKKQFDENVEKLQNLFKNYLELITFCIQLPHFKVYLNNLRYH